MYPEVSDGPRTQNRSNMSMIEWCSMWIGNFDIKAFEWSTHACEFNTLCLFGSLCDTLGRPFVSIEFDGT